MDKATEFDLINLAKQGDWAAFRGLVEGHHRRVYRLAHRLTGGHAEADAVTQDVFVQAYQAISKFEGRSRLITWLYSITVRKVRDYRRSRRGRIRTVSLTGRPEVSRDCRRPSVPGPAEALDRKELREMLDDAIMKLPLEQRVALCLVAQDGLSYRDAADVLDCSEGTVASRVWSARRWLRSRLASYLEG